METAKTALFDIETKIFKHKKLFNIISTATRYGKSTSFAYWIYKIIASNDNDIFVWIRRTEVEIRNTVIPLFKGLFLGNKDVFDKVKVNLQGVEIDDIRRVYFIPLSLYYNFKSLTDIAEKIKAIIWDEAIHCKESKRLSNEEYYFSELMDIIGRDELIPLYFLCNPYKRGVWFWENWASGCEPRGDKEMCWKKDNVLVFTAPLQKNRQEKGTAYLLKKQAQKRLSEQGLHLESESFFIVDKVNGKELYSFVFRDKIFTFYKNNYKEYFLKSREDEEDIPDKLLTFTRGDFSLYPTSIPSDWKYYETLFLNLLHSRLLFFDKHSDRDLIVETLNRNIHITSLNSLTDYF